jgi:hypothetical protein
LAAAIGAAATATVAAPAANNGVMNFSLFRMVTRFPDGLLRHLLLMAQSVLVSRVALHRTHVVTADTQHWTLVTGIRAYRSAPALLRRRRRLYACYQVEESGKVGGGEGI